MLTELQALGARWVLDETSVAGTGATVDAAERSGAERPDQVDHGGDAAAGIASAGLARRATSSSAIELARSEPTAGATAASPSASDPARSTQGNKRGAGAISADAAASDPAEPTQGSKRGAGAISADAAASDPAKPMQGSKQVTGAISSHAADAGPAGLSRRGGAGPSDHKAIVFDGQTVMVPIHTHAAARSPYVVRASAEGTAVLERDGAVLGHVRFPSPPRFYAGTTRAGVPYWKIAQLHGTDVLATTVLQHCVRYADRERACQFCAIGQSLEAGRTIARKSPEDLAEVAAAAVALDGVTHMVMTTGTPGTADRGARVLVEAAAAVSARVALPIQAQCEPPDDDAWFVRLRGAGVVTLGMHLEVVGDDVRRRIMPGKAEVPLARYFDAFARAVSVFGRGQVTTVLLAGLGDTAEATLEVCRRLVALGVYPFVVPFVPIRGTPLEHHPTPSPAFLQGLLAEVAAVIRDGGLARDTVRAGCGRCGACSTLAAHEAGV